MLRGLAVLISILLTSCATNSPARLEKRSDETAAHDAAQRWLKLLDDGDYEEAFEWEAQDFRMRRTQYQFVRSMQARRAPFGGVLSRKVIGAKNVKKLVGLPEGNYETIIFKTAFEKKSPTAERVILVKQEIGWRVVDYRIY
jgi:Protein of unknown function (DUF4019)